MATASIGGAIEKYYFMRDSPENIINKYQMLTGKPIMPPMWAFGWQQSRFGYATDKEWYGVV